MDDAGVDGGAPQPHQRQPRQGGVNAQGQQQDEYAQGDDALAQPDHLGVAELHGEEAAQRPARGDAEEEQPRVARRRLRRDAPVKMQVAAAPQDGGLLQGAVAE